MAKVGSVLTHLAPCQRDPDDHRCSGRLSCSGSQTRHWSTTNAENITCERTGFPASTRPGMSSFGTYSLSSRLSVSFLDTRRLEIWTSSSFCHASRLCHCHPGRRDLVWLDLVLQLQARGQGEHQEELEPRRSHQRRARRRVLVRYQQRPIHAHIGHSNQPTTRSRLSYSTHPCSVTGHGLA